MATRPAVTDPAVADELMDLASQARATQYDEPVLSLPLNREPEAVAVAASKIRQLTDVSA